MDKEFSKNQTAGADAVLALAEGGNPDAQFAVAEAFANTANMYDCEEAAQWYLKAAEQNHPRAQYHLGLMFLKGRGVPRDHTLFRVWMGRAANLGDAAAQYQFGMREHRLSMDKD